MGIEIATKMLTDAATAVAERQGRYGSPDKNFENIAAFWQAWLRSRYGEIATLTIDSTDVAAMCAMIKLARLAETPDHIDSWVDLAGYAACGRQVTAAERARLPAMRSSELWPSPRRQVTAEMEARQAEMEARWAGTDALRAPLGARM